jgi:capsular polysaccharide transport system permease protein
MNKLVHLSAGKLKLLLIALPLLLYGLYLGVFAADRYVSETTVSVRQAGSDSSLALPGAAMMLAGITPASHEDTLFLKEFVHSRGLLLKLQERLDLRTHFAAARADLPLRLPKDASLEDLVQYYRSRVEVLLDDRAALLTVRAQAFDAAFAQRLTQAILEESERFVNENSHRIAREQLRFAEGELQLASQRLQKAQGELLAFQSKNRILDPTVQAQASGALLAQLESARSKLEAELNGLRGFLNEDAYQVAAMRERIAAIKKQIDTESERATTVGKGGTRLNQLALEYQALELQAEFARDGYKLALAAVENARIDATRKIKSLVVIEPPSLPETAEYPLVAYNMATLFAICVLLYAIVRLVLATIREHLD